MDEELKKRFDDQDKKLETILRSAERLRKIFFWRTILTIVTIVVPILGLLVVLPRFLSTLNFTGLKGIGGF